MSTRFSTFLINFIWNSFIGMMKAGIPFFVSVLKTWFCLNSQILVKEKGIFTNVTSPTTKAKLRLLFEVAPLGFLVEKAGGYSSDGRQSVLDKVIETLDERTQVAYGSKEEIIRFEETLYGSSRLKSGVPVGASA